MREIEFRARLLNTGEWVYGVPVFDMTVCYIADIATHKLVDPETIGEYTGLKDKNGVEIYEGDIIAHPEWARFVVQWESGHARFVMIRPSDGYIALMYDLEDMEIVGNRFENSDLLK